MLNVVTTDIKVSGKIRLLCEKNQISCYELRASERICATLYCAAEVVISSSKLFSGEALSKESLEKFTKGFKRISDQASFDELIRVLEGLL